MNFADRMNEQAQAYDMSEKKVTAEEFDKAVAKAMDEIADEPKLEGAAKLLVPLIGMVFSHSVRKILFGEEK